MNIEILGELILGGTLKGAGVALVGWLIACRWKCRAAADRHTLWLLVLASFVILPLMQQRGPQWRILPKVFETVVDEPRVVPLANPSSVIEETSPSESWVPPVVSRTSSGSAVSMDSSEISSTEKLPWWAIVWMCGAAIVLGRVFVGRIALWLYGRQSENGKIQVLANELRDQMGMSRRVEVVLSARRKMPMTWGWRRPKILLPTAARDWERDRQEVVLLHELAHVKRRDAATQGLVQLVTAIYWFHPAVWFAVWRLVGERERACDQAVVDEGVKPSSYARHLMAVALADTSPLLCPSADMGMAARKGELEKRVQTLLETTSRRRMKWRWIVATIGGWLGVVCALSMVTAQESATSGLETAPPTLEGDLLAGEEPTDSEASVPEVTGWQLELRELTVEERNKLDRGDAVDRYPTLQARFKSVQGAGVYQIRGLKLYVDGVPFGLREAQDWSNLLSPQHVPSPHYLSLGLEGWEPLVEACENEIEWLPGKHSVQVAFLIESEDGQLSKLLSNVVRVDYPDLHETSAGGKLTEKASEFPEEISRDRYAEAVATLEQLKLSYGVKHPKMIEQQQLVDSLKAQARSTRDASPIMDRQLLKKRYDQEM